MYMIIKHTHLTIIALTLLFFLINFLLTIKGSDKVNIKLLKIGPHILYTLFIATAIYLVVVNPLNLYPFVNGWASSKLAGFVMYVLSIMFALKWAKSNIWRFVGFISAIFWFVMSAKLAYADRLKVKGLNEDTNSYIELVQSVLVAVS
ncbi:tryptophanyl-tRNA synthetase [Arsukibacterium sp. MJ3]|uniref:SirB2 family protein n=1 Tax=Arsukibacterium sp. MJ3 TaxID=1632859 RepID=UPI00062732BB|nr:SirB2 family protein [Arsukibacterium sp. MJ3]KKO49874.1 tryptophanyl-tRNA synthetase [Arsukibacterium sp. MJ3]